MPCSAASDHGGLSIQSALTVHPFLECGSRALPYLRQVRRPAADVPAVSIYSRMFVSFAISNGNGEDPVSSERFFIRGLILPVA